MVFPKNHFEESLNGDEKKNNLGFGGLKKFHFFKATNFQYFFITWLLLPFCFNVIKKPDFNFLILTPNIIHIVKWISLYIDLIYKECNSKCCLNSPPYEFLNILSDAQIEYWKTNFVHRNCQQFLVNILQVDIITIIK